MPTAFQVANRHARNGRVTIGVDPDGKNLLITDMSADEQVPESDCTNTESGGFFVAGEEGGVQRCNIEFTAILLKGATTDVRPGTIYDILLQFGQKTDPLDGFSGKIYVSGLKHAGQVSNNGPIVYTGTGVFTGEYTPPAITPPAG